MYSPIFPMDDSELEFSAAPSEKSLSSSLDSATSSEQRLSGSLDEGYSSDVTEGLDEAHSSNKKNKDPEEARREELMSLLRERYEEYKTEPRTAEISITPKVKIVGFFIENAAKNSTPQSATTQPNTRKKSEDSAQKDAEANTSYTPG